MYVIIIIICMLLTYFNEKKPTRITYDLVYQCITKYQM